MNFISKVLLRNWHYSCTRDPVITYNSTQIPIQDSTKAVTDINALKQELERKILPEVKCNAKFLITVILLVYQKMLPSFLRTSLTSLSIFAA